MGGALDASFRRAMRTLTSAVCVVSTAHAEHRFGMTATAVTSLSADPPSLLICVNRAAGLHRPLIESRRFCLNVLHAHQTALVESFGGGRAGEDRFQCGLWTESQDGVPCLENAQANVFCDVDVVHPYATHSVVIGASSRCASAAPLRRCSIRTAATPSVSATGSIGLFRSAASGQSVQAQGRANRQESQGE